jgi:hypothetical protein
LEGWNELNAKRIETRNVKERCYLKPYLKVENPNIVVLVREGLQFRSTKPSNELAFDSTKPPIEILRTLKKTARTMQGVSVTSTSLVGGGTITVSIAPNETNDIPRYIELQLKGNPPRVVEVATFMRNYNIDLANTFDRSINRLLE